ncbi:MAG: hypothetical protein IJA85_12070 [Clostridia bacterium]|nr:hypothetical protein [Clostridia bacterium]
MKPFVIKETYNTGDYTVAAANLLDYGADPTGTADSSAALQAAIDEIHGIGGGVIYLPEGSYALRERIEVKTAVTLRGEWISPEREACSDKGTLLLCYAGRGEEEGEAQITMRACTGLKDVTLFYPEQDFESPVPYSPAVRQHGVDSVTLENVTMINPWLGVQCGSDANELHYLKNVYISPIKTGFFMDMTTDIGRMENLNISPRYLAEFCGIELERVQRYMLANATGVCMGRSDWEYGYAIHVEWCNVGFMITSFKDSGPNTQLSDLRLHNCQNGFKLINVNPYGVALSDSVISCDIEGLEAAIISDAKFETVMQLNGVDLIGPYKHLVVHKGSGQLSFVNCRFEDWTDAAFLQMKGGLSVEQCSFAGSGSHFDLKEGIGGCQILGCEFGGELRIDCDKAAEEELVFSEAPLNLNVAPRGGHKPYPYGAKPASDALYLVTDFGAAADGVTDNTEAFQKALNEASKTGGIVYAPAGWYRFDGSIHVPCGVELRGVFEVPCHTMGGGTVLQPFADRDNEDGAPFITLGEKAGVRGIVIHYPEQDPAEPHKYPWTLQSRGKFCYVINTVFVNPWQGVDFASYPSEGHYISYISGAPIRCGIFVGSNEGEGWVENIQYNPHYWFRCSLPNAPTGKDWHSFWHNQIKYLEALKFGYNECEHLLGTFVFAALHGLMFVNQDGKGTSGKFIGHGTDGGENGLYIEGIGDADLINTELVTIESPNTRVYMLTAEGATGKARMYNTLMWGAPHYAVVIGGGDVDMQQTNFVHSGNMSITVNGGKASFSASYLYTNKNNVTVNGGKCALVGNMTPRRAEKRIDCAPAMDIEHKGGEITEHFNWSK